MKKQMDIDKALVCAPLLGEPASEVVTEALLELRAARKRIAELESDDDASRRRTDDNLRRAFCGGDSA